MCLRMSPFELSCSSCKDGSLIGTMNSFQDNLKWCCVWAKMGVCLILELHCLCLFIAIDGNVRIGHLDSFCHQCPHSHGEDCSMWKLKPSSKESVARRKNKKGTKLKLLVFCIQMSMFFEVHSLPIWMHFLICFRMAQFCRKFTFWEEIIGNAYA